MEGFGRPEVGYRLEKVFPDGVWRRLVLPVGNNGNTFYNSEKALPEVI
ncbi:hypothetical protein BH24ACT20_BH24ACT20_16250 [soil metagenome]